MLEERPPAEPPARASAITGAKARLAQKRSARMMRQLVSRFSMRRSLKTRGLITYARIWGVSGPAEAPASGMARSGRAEAPLSGIEPDPRRPACLIDQRPCPNNTH